MGRRVGERGGRRDGGCCWWGGRGLGAPIWFYDAVIDGGECFMSNDLIPDIRIAIFNGLPLSQDAW
jgi:hypothetical protein